MDRCTQLYIDGEMQGPSYGSGIGRASIPEEGKWDGDRCWVEDQDGAHVVECERRDGREAIRWRMDDCPGLGDWLPWVWRDSEREYDDDDGTGPIEYGVCMPSASARTRYTAVVCATGMMMEMP